MMQPTHRSLARQITTLFASLPQVEAVALSGSHGGGGGKADSSSDIDLYVYTREPIPIEERHGIVEKAGGASRSSLNLNYWGPGDEWFDSRTGIEIDIVYFGSSWMEDQVRRVVEDHNASLGYSTCLWHTIRQSECLFDRQGWFARIQERCMAAYPEKLRQNIVAFNYPVLRGIILSYVYQIEKAVKRRDIVSINHRLSALFASYFDILFAVNRSLHPGEKRLLEFAVEQCKTQPVNMEAEILSILSIFGTDPQEIPSNLTTLLDHLDRWLETEGFESIVADTNSPSAIGEVLL